MLPPTAADDRAVHRLIVVMCVEVTAALLDTIVFAAALDSATAVMVMSLQS